VATMTPTVTSESASRPGPRTRGGHPWLARVASWIPEGGTLPDDVWESRHTAIVRVGYAAAVVLTVIATVQPGSRFSALTVGLWVFVPCLLAKHVLRGRTARSSLASLALLVAVAISIALFHGQTEAHFGFFVVVGLLTLYQERIPFLISITYVVLHHGIMGTIAPMLVLDSSRCADNPWKWAAIHGAYIVAASGVFVTAWRLNEEYRRTALAADARLLSSEKRFRGLVQGSVDLTLLADRDGTVRYASPACERILGVVATDLVGHPLRGLVDPDDWATVEAHTLGTPPGATTDGRIDGADCRMVTADGTRRVVHVTFSDQRDDPAVDGVVLHVHDVTDRRRLEAELRHAQKLESIGALSAGIAHEINTPIQFIGDNLRFLMDAYADRGRLFALMRANVAQEALAEVVALEQEIDADYITTEAPLAFQQTVEGVARVATIVRAMKAFGHPGSEDKSAADLNEAVQNTLAVTGNITKAVAEVVTDLGDIPLVWCHPGDINQVLVNLVVNAAHAVGDRMAETSEPGRITVRTRVEDDHVVLEIEDTGGGISDDIADRVFEPFFTTKEVGRGTGQGLALCYTLVTDRHGGGLTFRSTPGTGTTFVVRLPVGGPS
jgi:PAS domain S-box-containing protein